MRAADLAPRLLLPSLSTLLPGPFREREIRNVTGISGGQWRDLGRAFPGLGFDPGPAAARARRRLHALLGRAFSTSNERHAAVFRGSLPGPEPCVYATAHIGDLRSLRYLLRLHIAVATVVNEDREHRASGGKEHRELEERIPRDFPQILPSSSPHALRSALRRGSLIVSADLPEAEGAVFPCLGGTLRLDRRPFRLALLSGVACRPVFLTAPQGRLTITVGAALPVEEAEAVSGFARVLANVAEETPFEIDGVTWWNRLGPR